MSDSRTVLLVMDFQNGIVERVGHGAPLPAAVRAIDAARTAGVPVMFVRVAFRTGYPEAGATNMMYSGVAQSGDVMTQDHPATQVHGSLPADRTSPYSSSAESARSAAATSTCSCARCRQTCWCWPASRRAVWCSQRSDRPRISIIA
jgi:nicotinamidase-related amidase